MNNNYLLDTGIAGAYLNNDIAIRRRLKGIVSFLSIIVVGELYHGAFNSTTQVRNLAALREYVGRQEPLPCDPFTAEQFSLIATSLQKRGERIPHNDMWIAAQAIQHGLILITKDQDFEHIDGLKLERW